MTLTGFEQSLVGMDSGGAAVSAPRFWCAGPCQHVRAQLATGETFANALARTLKDPRHSSQLAASGQLSAFAALTGP
jgi:hypothetical protein